MLALVYRLYNYLNLNRNISESHLKCSFQKNTIMWILCLLFFVALTINRAKCLVGNAVFFHAQGHDSFCQTKAGCGFAHLPLAEFKGLGDGCALQLVQLFLLAAREPLPDEARG